MGRQSKPQNLVVVMSYKLNVFILNVKATTTRHKPNTPALIKKISVSLFLLYCCFDFLALCIIISSKGEKDRRYLWKILTCWRFCFLSAVERTKCWHPISWDQLTFLCGLALGLPWLGLGLRIWIRMRAWQRHDISSSAVHALVVVLIW